jgi:hypothetical protein
MAYAHPHTVGFVLASHGKCNSNKNIQRAGLCSPLPRAIADRQSGNGRNRTYAQNTRMFVRSLVARTLGLSCPTRRSAFSSRVGMDAGGTADGDDCARSSFRRFRVRSRPPRTSCHAITSDRCRRPTECLEYKSRGSMSSTDSSSSSLSLPASPPKPPTFFLINSHGRLHFPLRRRRRDHQRVRHAHFRAGFEQHSPCPLGHGQLHRYQQRLLLPGVL